MNVRVPLLSTLLALAACGDGGGSPPDAGVPDAAAPDAFVLAAPADRAALFQAGPYAFGYRTASVTYRPAGATTDRTLNLNLWYPAEAGTGDALVYSVAGLIAVPRDTGRANAAALAQGRFPVIVYSHGYGGVGLAAFSYGEYFASWGFVVAAPDHTGNTALDQTISLAMGYLVRPQDLSATLDWVTGDPASPVKGRTSEDVAAIGHSMGGYSVLSVLGARGDWAAVTAGCANSPGSCEVMADPAARAKLDAGFADPRFDLAVAQTPVIMLFADGELAALSRPVMLMTARRDATLPWATEGEPGWRRLDGADDTWIDLLNGGHYSPIAICDYVDPALLAVVGLDVTHDGCGPDFTPISEIVPAITAYAHAFVRLHSLGESRWRAVIAGEPFHDEVSVTVGAGAH